MKRLILVLPLFSLSYGFFEHRTLLSRILHLLDPKQADDGRLLAKRYRTWKGAQYSDQACRKTKEWD